MSSLRVFSFGLALVWLAVDFVTKRHVLANIPEYAGGINIIDGLLNFTYVRNSGAAFGMLQGARWPFVIVSAVAVVGFTIVLARGQLTMLRRLSLSLILAGAAGNLIDRIFYEGLVVDFIQMRWPIPDFPVFNVADIGVSVGAALLVLDMIFDDRRRRDAGDIQVEGDVGVASPTAGDGLPKG